MGEQVGKKGDKELWKKKQSRGKIEREKRL
jgi:hypothetical protein